MSLLNNMLKNLDKRNQDQVQKQIDKIVLSGVQVPPQKINSWAFMAKPRVISVIVFLAIVLIYLSIHLIGVLKKKHSPAFLFTPSGNFSLVKLIPKSLKSKATLQNIFITRGASEIVLQFTFDKIVRYELSTNNDCSQSTIVLRNADFNNKLLSPVDFIKAFTTKIIGKDLYLSIETVPGTEIKVIQDQTQKPVRLIFILTNNTQPAIEIPKPMMTKTLVPLVPPTPTELALISYQDALSLLDHGYFDQAIPLLKKALKEDPTLVDARKNLVILLIQDDEIITATNYVKSGLKINPDAVSLIELDAKLLLLKHLPEEALRVLQKLSPDIMQEPEYYALLASLEQQLGNAVTAEQIYKQLLTIDGSNANWWAGMGLALESQNKKNDALRYYKQANALGGLSPHVQMGVQERITKLGR